MGPCRVSFYQIAFITTSFQQSAFPAFSQTNAPTDRRSLTAESFSFSNSVDHRDQLPDDLERHRSDGDDEQRRQDTKKDREYQLDSQLGRLLFGDLAGLHAHELGMIAQRGRDAGSETVGLDQDGHQLPQVLYIGSIRQVPQRLDAALTRLQLQIHQGEFF